MIKKAEGLEAGPVLVRAGKEDEAFKVSSIEAIVQDASVKAVAEVMGGVEPAFTYACAALKAGKHFVTSNKALVAAKGTELAKLAEVVPEEVQLTALTIPEPPPQMLSDPKNPKRPPLLGPTNTVENVQFRISGRTAATASVTALMEAVEGETFSDWIVADNDKKNAAARKKKRIHIRQEARAGEDGVRMLAFEVEFRCKERRFEK